MFILEPDWISQPLNLPPPMARALAYSPENALNAICPYFTMFPLEFPLRVLRKHTKESPTVMDPFCGRGTTLFAARKLGLAARGIDSSPIAVAIAQAKLAVVEVEEIIDLAKVYIDRYRSPSIPASEFFLHAFSPQVLKQICAVRKGLMNTKKESNSTIILRAAMLGCLHGPLNKNPENRAYFSNQMPRTFSAKPEYSVRYWRDRRLKAPQVDILTILRRKIERLQNLPISNTKLISNARHGDSRLAKSMPSSVRDFSVVVTSPPYYGMKTYVQDQWLRNWFLGGPGYVEYGNVNQLNHSGTDAFTKSLGLVWRNMARTKADTLHMHIRFGIIPSAKIDAKALLRCSLEKSGVQWREISVRPAQDASWGKRQANHMAASSSPATEYDFHVERI